MRIFRDTNITPIGTQEFMRRRNRLAERAKAAGYSGTIAFARQGTASTRAGYVIYLSDYYTPFFDGLEDCAPYWVGLGHAAVVTSASGESILVTDMNHYYFDSGAPYRSRITVIHDTNVLRGIATAAKKLAITTGRIGLIGEEILSVKRHALLQSLMPHLLLEWNDALLDNDMMVKSEAELQILRTANHIVGEITTAALMRAVPGVTEQDLAGFVRKSIAEAGGELLWMRPGGLAELNDGDIYFMSVVAWFRGYFVDIARNCVVGRASIQREQLIGYLNDYILSQAQALKPGTTAEEAAIFGYNYFVNSQSKITRADIENGAVCPFPAFGHGIGLSYGKPYIREGDKTVLRPGMVIAIEANYQLENVGLAEAEVTVEIGEKGPVLLSGL